MDIPKPLKIRLRIDHVKSALMKDKGCGEKITQRKQSSPEKPIDSRTLKKRWTITGCAGLK